MKDWGIIPPFNPKAVRGHAPELDKSGKRQTPTTSEQPENSVPPVVINVDEDLFAFLARERRERYDFRINS